MCPKRCQHIVLVSRLRGLVQSPCGKINVIMTLGGEGVLVYNCIVSIL